ncbi:MAG: hypothetical protein QMC81_02555, partial [Thermoanaerobacterales bacterium]|nr:hypothetical protein [Thermoanaerobacterales bacterium]
LWQTLDPVLVVLYRVTGHPVADFFLGTMLVAFLTVVVGEFTASIVYRLNDRHLKTLNARMVQMHNRSLQALREGEKERYKSANREANDAFGRVFFNAVALSAAYLWPCFFILGWMQLRFMGINIPVPYTGLAANYVVVFLVCYVLGRMLFNVLRPRLPYFSGVQKLLDEQNRAAQGLDSFVH